MISRIPMTIAALLLLTAGSAACPDPSQYGERHEESGKSLYEQKRFRVQAGGTTEIDSCRNVRSRSGSASGYVTTSPDFSFNLRGMADYRLQMDVISECDSILLINTGAENWYYDDDDAGNLDARIELNRPSDGWLDVWVGTHNGAYCNATLSLETFER